MATIFLIRHGQAQFGMEEEAGSGRHPVLGVLGGER